MFDLIHSNGDTAGSPVERELLRFIGPVLGSGLAIFNEELQHVVPRLNVVEDEKEYRVTAELPGVSEKDIRVNLTKDGLEISGEKRIESLDQGKNAYRFERAFGTFQRFVRIPDDADRSKANASFKQGVLKIVLPKRADAAPKSLDIKSE